MTEDEMVGWHHQLNAHGFGWTPGVGDGQGGLECCSSWDCKESDTTKMQQQQIIRIIHHEHLDLFLECKNASTY